MPARLRTEALVLDRRDLGESDRVMTLLTRERGKISAIARGARRSKRRFGGCLELFTHLEVALTERPRGGWMQLDEAVLVDGHERLKGNLLAIAQASYLAELVSVLLQEEDPVPEIFALLLEALAGIDRGPVGPAALRRFELDLLRHLGLAPQVDACQECGKTEGATWVFDHDRGGILCPSCVAGPRGEPLDAPAVQLLRSLQAGEAAPTVPLGTMAKVRDLLARIIDQIAARPLKAREFLRHLAEEDVASRKS